MIRLLKEIRLVMYFFQWVLLLSFFFFYLDAPNWNYHFLTSFLIVCTLYLVILCFAFPRRAWFLLGLVDMAIALFFIVQTGKWSSPFMLYVYTTMLWLMVVLRLEQVLLIVVLFLLAASLLPEIHTFTMILPQTRLNQLRLILDITIWVTVIFVSLALLRMMKKLYKKCFHVYMFLRKTASDSTFHLCAATEQLIRRMFRAEQAYLCLYHEQDAEGDWKREYFLGTLLDEGAQEWERFSVHVLDDYTGREDTYACMPMRLDNEAWGCLIFSIPPKSSIDRVDLLLLKSVSAIVCHQGKQNRARYELAQSLHKEMRKKLAQDMHDGLAQQLFFLSAQLYGLKRSLPVEVTEKLTDRLEQIEERIKWCHGEVRNTISHLREFRESEQIAEAIEQLLGRMTVGTDLQIRFTAKGRVMDEEFPVQDAIYRMVEEATANAVKHAQAKCLTVSVEASSLQVKVRVKDDGIGFLPEEKESVVTYGVMGMRERILQVGGTFQIRSKPDEGTEVLAIIPRKGVEMFG
ncbi:GAF domain-containing sensor histidine kinase [Brevibacillus sp. NRS-1366]|uniref:GAF domain-containing sensor histidine kinase n=1 Tax=Brevibacillus sp. NRS-1366 TaxID=3233899 RepID=UPI003D19D7E1